MLKKLLSLIILTALIYFVPYNLNAQTKINFDKLADAVVVVMLYDYENKFIGHGSGFIIDSKGTIVTNYHVVEDAYFFKVRTKINGREIDYDVKKIVKGDQSKDLAIISLENPNGTVFPFLKLSKEFPSKGDKCWAIGTPVDIKYMNTLTAGIISNTHNNEGVKILQIDASVTFGNSGGALINSKGEVIGVVSSIAKQNISINANINFAVWIGELNNLPSINKERLIEPKSTLCFYTKSQYIDKIHLYIDGEYVGRFSFSKSFSKYYEPECGAEGTITQVLKSGTYRYRIEHAKTSKYIDGGVVTLTPGECKKISISNIIDPSYSYDNKIPHTSYTDDYSYTKDYGYTKDYSKVKDYRFLPGINLAFHSVNLTYYFNEGKYGIQVFWFREKNIFNDDYVKMKTIQNYYGIDFKRVFRPSGFWVHPYFGPSVRIYNTKIDVDSTYYLSTSTNLDTTVHRTLKQNHIFFNARVGIEFVIFKRLAINFDIGFGYLTNRGLIRDADLVLGYRLGRKR